MLGKCVLTCNHVIYTLSIQKGKKTLLNQSENEKKQQPETLTPQELRRSLLAKVEAGKQMIEALDDEQLEEVVGGAGDVAGVLAGMRASSPPPAPRLSNAPVKPSERILYVPKSHLEGDLQSVLKRSYSTGDIPDVVGRRPEFNRILGG